MDPTRIATLRDKETCLSQMEEIKSKPSENAKAKLRAEYGVKETNNPLFSLSVDLYR